MLTTKQVRTNRKILYPRTENITSEKRPQKTSWQDALPSFPCINGSLSDHVPCLILFNLWLIVAAAST